MKGKNGGGNSEILEYGDQNARAPKRRKNETTVEYLKWKLSKYFHRHTLMRGGKYTMHQTPGVKRTNLIKFFHFVHESCCIYVYRFWRMQLHVHVGLAAFHFFVMSRFNTKLTLSLIFLHFLRRNTVELCAFNRIAFTIGKYFQWIFCPAILIHALNVAYTDFPHGISWTFFERTMDEMLDSFANVQIEIWFVVDFCGILSLASLSSLFPSLSLFHFLCVHWLSLYRWRSTTSSSPPNHHSSSPSRRRRHCSK